MYCVVAGKLWHFNKIYAYKKRYSKLPRHYSVYTSSIANGIDLCSSGTENMYWSDSGITFYKQYKRKLFCQNHILYKMLGLTNGR